MRIGQNSTQLMVQRMFATRPLWRKATAAACMSLVADYAKEVGNDKFYFKNFVRHFFYNSCVDNWALEEFAWRCGEDTHTYQVFRNALKALSEAKFIEFNDLRGQDNYVVVLGNGKAWVEEARRTVLADYEGKTLESDEEPGVEGISNTVPHLNLTLTFTLNDVGHRQHHSFQRRRG